MGWRLPCRVPTAAAVACLLLHRQEATPAPAPPWRQQFGHTIRNWDFEIAENPQAGQYRYLQFAWHGDAKTTGLGLALNAPGSGQVAFTAGKIVPPELTTVRKVADGVPQRWTVVRVDLWEVFKKPVRIQAMTLLAAGGVGQFDQAILGRTEKDLPAEKK